MLRKVPYNGFNFYVDARELDIGIILLVMHAEAGSRPLPFFFSPGNSWVNSSKFVLKLEFVSPHFPRYFNYKMGGAGNMLAAPIPNFETKLSRLIVLN